MVQITFELDTSPIGKLPSKLQAAKAKGLQYSAETMVRFLMQNSPVDHGVLRQWFIDSIDEEEAHIKSLAEYAAAQNYGAVAHDIFISPKNKSALFWGEYDGGGNPIMSKGHIVHIPALQGKHFVEQSFNELQPLVPGFFLKALEEE